jgi:hypothetical protein
MADNLSVMRYLTFEITDKCNLGDVHTKCPNSHPDRYRYGYTEKKIDNDLILDFWRWAQTRYFRGIVMFHGYCEPTLEIKRIRDLMVRMRQEDPGQPFQLFSSNDKHFSGFDLFKFTNYKNGKELDDRILTVNGAGKPYGEMQKSGWCGRCYGWELFIDYHGNWNLCCNDWRNEESVGNLFKDDWDRMFLKFLHKSKNIRWDDERSYLSLPRMCRSCLDKNPGLHRSGASF